MSVQIVRLSTGEELIAHVDDGPVKYKLSDVAILIPTQENSLGLAPFMAYGKFKELKLDPKDVMFMIDPVDGLLSQYQQMFQKIVTPSSSIIS